MPNAETKKELDLREKIDRYLRDTELFLSALGDVVWLRDKPVHWVGGKRRNAPTTKRPCPVRRQWPAGATPGQLKVLEANFETMRRYLQEQTGQEWYDDPIERAAADRLLAWGQARGLNDLTGMV